VSTRSHPELWFVKAYEAFTPRVALQSSATRTLHAPGRWVPAQNTRTARTVMGSSKSRMKYWVRTPSAPRQTVDWSASTRRHVCVLPSVVWAFGTTATDAPAGMCKVLDTGTLRRDAAHCEKSGVLPSAKVMARSAPNTTSLAETCLGVTAVIDVREDDKTCACFPPMKTLL
jgi:hypothetical protein